MKCIVTSWGYMDLLCCRVAEEIRKDRYYPDAVVALAKGGWFAGNVLCDLLGIPELISVRVRHYTGMKEKKLEVSDFGDLKGKRVLIVDDVANTGRSMSTAKLCAEEREAEEVRTAVLQLIHTSSFAPDYFGDYVVEDAWIIFPWNFYEDIMDVVSNVLDREMSEWEIKWKLYEKFGIDPIALEMAQPGKFENVLVEMERRGIAERVEKGGRQLWRLSSGD